MFFPQNKREIHLTEKSNVTVIKLFSAEFIKTLSFLLLN